jgi:hypothetical protein
MRDLDVGALAGAAAAAAAAANEIAGLKFNASGDVAERLQLAREHAENAWIILDELRELAEGRRHRRERMALKPEWPEAQEDEQEQSERRSIGQLLRRGLLRKRDK